MSEYELVTKSWLKHVLESSKKHGDGEIDVCCFSAERALAKGENYISVPVRTSVVYTVDGDVDEHRADLFIKLLPLGKEHRAISEGMGAFVREAEVYRELIPDMRRNADLAGAPKECHPDVPKCVYAEGSGPDAAVVMEDLGMYGYRLAKRYEGATETETRLVMRAFAKFHANGIELARKMGLQEAGTLGQKPEGIDRYANLYSDPFKTEMMRAAFADNAIFNNMEQAVRASGEAALADRLRHFLDVTCAGNTLDRMEMLNAKIADRRLFCFRLGDCWLNNMMFRYDLQDSGSHTPNPVTVKLLDLQIVQAGIPFPDLHYFFGTSTRKSVFAKRRQLLEEDYYPELFRVLELLGSPLRPADYPFEKFWTVFRDEYSHYCLIAAMFVLPIVLADKAEVPDIDKGQDLTIDDLKTMTKDVLHSAASGRVIDRFVNIVRTLVDEGVI